MRDSLMLSSLTVGEKQHPRIGGCVRVFFQLFDWNRRLSCKKRIFSQKQLSSERSIRRAFNKYKDDSGESSLSSIVDANQTLLITNVEEEDNLQDCCKKEEIIGGEVEEGMIKSNEYGCAVTSPGFSMVENESIHEGALQVKSPGVIAKLMGLESLPSPPCLLSQSEIKQKPSPTLASVDPSPSTVITAHDDYIPKVHNLAFEHGLPDEELNALLSELNGNMSTILSSLPPHFGIITSRNRPSTTTTRISSTTQRNSTVGVSSPSCSCPATFTPRKVNVGSAGASSPSIIPTQDVSTTCSATVIQTHVNLETGASFRVSDRPSPITRATSFPASDCPSPITQATVSTRNASSSSIRLAPNSYEERANKPELKGAQSWEDQLMCSRDDLSELEQQMGTCTRAGEGNVVTIKRGKRMKGKSSISVAAGKRLSEKSMNAGMDMNVQCSPQELQDVGRPTCKSVRRKKVDTSMQQEVDVRGSPSYQLSIENRPLEDRGCPRGSPNDQAIVPLRKQEEGGHVRGSPYDQSSCSLASSRNAGKINCNHDQFLPSANFAIKYNVGFFDEYHKSRGKLDSASKPKHSNDHNEVENANQSNVIRAAVADHEQSRTLDCRNAARNSSSGANEEDCSFIRVLIKRRAARELAAATAAIEAAGLLRTASPDHVDMSAVARNSAESLQSLMSSCCSTEMDNDPNRREKLSAGRSEAGGGDFIQVMRPIKYNVDGSRAAGAACHAVRNCECVQGGGTVGDSNDRGVESGGMAAAAAAAASMACTKESAGAGMSAEGVHVEIYGAHAPGSGKNTTAAILQDVISALNGNTPDVSSSRPRRRPHRHMLVSDDDAGTPSTADGNDTESTWESGGGCWAAASQPSPVSVLISPFDDDVSPAGDDTCWIQTEDDYVAALLAATSENGKTNLPPAELFGKLEERVIAAWPDSEVPPTRGYRRLVFDCVCEALGQAVAMKDCRGNRRWRARVLFEEMCRWRQQGACDIVLDDLVEAELGKACNRWLSFEVQTRHIALRLERTIFDLLIEELVCDLVLT